MAAELSRTSALASRHTALGSGLEDWNGMGTAWSYTTNPEDEHDAVREAVGMFDMSPLKKIYLSGGDALEVLDHLTTRDIGRIAEGQAAYLSVLTDQGTMADDAIVYNLGRDGWMIVHGSGDTMALLQASAAGKSVEIAFTDDLHDVSVQGPESLAILNAHCDLDLAPLAYFHHVAASLFGHPCRISRTGYSGERGYEIFADAAVVGDIWDQLVAAGVMPCSFTALDKLRIEAGLLFYGYDMTTEHTPFEVGLGFTVARSKTGYRGHQALMQAKGKEKISNVCLVIDHPGMVAGGEQLFHEGKPAGVVNSPCFSHRLNKSLALAHVSRDMAALGTKLDLSGGDINTTATVAPMPIYDPGKNRTHQA
ncbi:aminomethyltransferase family protein [Hoeflea sp. G2-23]|uniref:Aminomethyltransferase family protein n=1 Tax=Hoeflea algicola TaxID=2983763 RepID=A0ABT3Z381_9HYPH|nr:aminomethyltransferase family protein [Hoeflea algicola]MCY0146228.1 aminomethyltransferase family protein [Hoeflea algicola]